MSRCHYFLEYLQSFPRTLFPGEFLSAAQAFFDVTAAQLLVAHDTAKACCEIVEIVRVEQQRGAARISGKTTA
jgi:hypothetical protein